MLCEVFQCELWLLVDVDAVFLLWQVLDEYFKRGGEGVRVTFVQVKGFNLLAGQLKQYKVSFELMSALCSIVVGQDINLKGDQLQ